jgi:two-component system, chemotaxis family, protein-glutamate methylesterase/glutaminase
MSTPDSRRIRAVVVDDSATVRELLVAILHNAGDIEVVGTGSTGKEAVRLVSRLRPDVLTMDIRMPVMDGLEATRWIMREVPTPIVIVTGSLMCDDIDLTMEALRAGALTVVHKPGLADSETCDKVVQAVRLMSSVLVIHHWNHRQRPALAATASRAFQTRAEITQPRPLRVIGLAASTGGPAALATVLRGLSAQFPLPILVVQHITKGFASGLAEWLNHQTDLHVVLAGHGDAVLAGTVLLAPDDYHLEVNVQGVVELSKQPVYRGLRPSANYLFQSLARAYGARAAGVILTGMGDDGCDGLETLHAAGGLTIAQDEQNCVVFGMPREAIARHAVDYVLPLDQIAPLLNRFTKIRAGMVQDG